MSTFTKFPLSGSTDGRQILISATTSGSGNQLHTPAAGTTSLDEVWLYAYNDATGSVQTSINWGSLAEPNDVVRFSVPSKSGRTLLVDGKLLRNGLTISAYAAIANVITFDGFVNRVS